MNFTDNTFSRYDPTLHTITVTRCSPDMAVQTLQPVQQRPTYANAHRVSDHINSADTLSVSELKTLLVLLVISGPTPPPPPQHC